MRTGYTLSEVIATLLIVALAAVVFLGVLGNALIGMSRVYHEIEKTFEANEELEKYFSGATSDVVIETSTLTITDLATSLEVKLVRPNPEDFGNSSLFIFEP